jgi:Asp-tRNA(Asn)/Glu-tRNA(Gln) amidotransferase A subunit family amidase
VASGFAPLSLGTETQGSISCPASFASLYGLKLSGGLVSVHGILQSSPFDSPGILARSPWDIANLLSTMVGYDSRDTVPSEAPTFEPEDFSKYLSGSWQDVRIGVADKRWFWDLIGVAEASDEEKVCAQLGLIRVVLTRTYRCSSMQWTESQRLRDLAPP